MDKGTPIILYLANLKIQLLICVYSTISNIIFIIYSETSDVILNEFTFTLSGSNNDKTVNNTLYFI